MELLFAAVVTWLVIHELDAMYHHEWRFFFAPIPVTDETAFRIFTALHAPALLVVLWVFETPDFQRGFDVFVIAHAGAHLVLRDHPKVEFDTWFSAGWIYGGALLGAAHLYTTL
ncbi:DUF6713 family protein [Halomicroarcula sp. GCM10025817]|uniref:DUF6713 family protein n=1 Tax=Haloarcula TaxID=2237 RepID=UPI0023E887E8|nr:DUF6713 family protein [Halomicroarcula sp. SYNS111]